MFPVAFSTLVETALARLGNRLDILLLCSGRARAVAKQTLRAYSSVGLERSPDKTEVPGSNPGMPTFAFVSTQATVGEAHLYVTQYIGRGSSVVEHGTENLGVDSSILSRGTFGVWPSWLRRPDVRREDPELKFMEKYYVYILQSLKNGRYYIGASSDPFRRLEEHNNNKEKSTKNRGPWKLCLMKEYDSLKEVRRIEYKLKKLKSKVILDKIVQEQDIKMEV